MWWTKRGTWGQSLTPIFASSWSKMGTGSQGNALAVHCGYPAIYRIRCRVWAHALRKRCLTNRLVRLQRSACISITGAMSTTPTTAMECILGLLPLDLHIQGRAIATWHRMQSSGQTYWSPLQTGPKSHIGWLAFETDRIPILKVNAALLHNSRLIYLDTRRFGVEILPRWSTDLSLQKDGIVCYTDGSRADGRTGCGFTVWGHRGGETIELASASIYLGELATVFQAELFAIHSVAGWLADQGFSGEHIAIFSDSQSVLEALRGGTTNSRLLIETYERLQLICDRNSLGLSWIPGHSGFSGNELADNLARHGSSMQVEGPEPFIPITSCVIKKVIRRH